MTLYTADKNSSVQKKEWRVVAMFTEDYAPLAERLFATCESFGIPYHGELIKDKKYRRVISHKPAFMLEMLKKFKQPIVYLDVDFEVMRYPTLFDNPMGYDFMIYNWYADDHNFIAAYNPTQLLCSSGVIYWNYTQAALSLLKAWKTMALRNRDCADDQLLDTVFNAEGYISKVNYQWLPQSYLRIAPYFPETDPVLNHQDDPGTNGPKPMHISKASRYGSLGRGWKRLRTVPSAGFSRLKAILRKWRHQQIRNRDIRHSIEQALQRSHPPVIVYTMAKSASTTIQLALLEADRCGVFKVHRMNPENIRRYRQERRAKGWTGENPYFDDLGLALREHLINKGHRVKIITLVREPVGRNISAYFQILDLLWQTPNAHETIALDRLIEAFPDKGHHYVPLTWFEDEMKAVLGIDVYQHPFSPEAGYVHISHPQHEVLILRADLDDTSKAQHVGAFLGVEPLTLAKKNVSSQKNYAPVYQEFLRNVSLPEHYINEMLKARYTRHFFSPEEIARLRSKWSGNNNGPSLP